MKKIALYSGTFDPITNGHLWVIQESLKLFDEVHVLIGKHPHKDPWFSVDERINMIETVAPSVKVDVLYTGDIIWYAKKLDGDVSIVRGLRKEKDAEYELDIVERIRAAGGNFHFLFIPPAKGGSTISSSNVKSLVASEAWTEVEKMVPLYVYDKLRCRKKNKWIVLEPEVASIFENTTASYGPPNTAGNNIIQPPIDRLINMLSTSGHHIDMNDELGEIMDYFGAKKSNVHIHFYGKIKDNFARLVRNGFIQFPKIVTATQVREMLDPCPYNVIVSEIFQLMKIRIDSVKPLGERYLPASQSLGPIIVEANEVIGNNTTLGNLGPVVVIEGKHRWLDAKERGEKDILAYVGIKAIKSLATTASFQD